MAVGLRRIFVAVMCIGVMLSAANALGLICEYTCASGLGHSHGHETGVLNAAYAGSERHQHSVTAEFRVTSGSPDGDSDCSSINVLVVATGGTLDVPAPDRAGAGVVNAESYAKPTQWNLATAVTGSPPLGADSSFLVTPVSLRI